ncbi:MAG: ABC transporter permease [Chloroflexota bacterium]
MARLRAQHIPQESGILVVVLVVFTAMALLSPQFGTVGNVLVLLLNGAVVGFLAMGQTFVLLTGGIDLSTAANMALTGVLGTLFMAWGLPWPAAVALALSCSLVFGLVNGVLVRYVGLPAFIATFGIQGVLASLAQIITKGASITAADTGFAVLGQGKIFGVPLPVILMLTVAVCTALFMRWTPLALHIYAFGGNPRAARLAGVNTARVTLFVYGVSAVCAGIGGLITASRLMVGFPYVGSGNELFYSIAAAVVGGVSLFGGVGTIPGAVVGAILIATISNGMNVLNVSSYWQPLVIGLIILGAVSADTYRMQVRGRGFRGRSTTGGPRIPQATPLVQGGEPQLSDSREPLSGHTNCPGRESEME